MGTGVVELVLALGTMAENGQGERTGSAVSSLDEAMGRYAQGDAAAFDPVYEGVAPRLERYLRSRIRDRARSEDIIQQTFLQMHRARGTFIAGAEVLPWAFAIARRLMIDSGRKTRREEHMEMRDDDPESRTDTLLASISGEQIVEAREAHRCLALAMDRLSEAQRTAFQLVKSEGMSHEQAASALGTTVTGIKLRVHRAYVALRGAIGEWADPPLGPGIRAASTAGRPSVGTSAPSRRAAPRERWRTADESVARTEAAGPGLAV